MITASQKDLPKSTAHPKHRTGEGGADCADIAALNRVANAEVDARKRDDQEVLREQGVLREQEETQLR